MAKGGRNTIQHVKFRMLDGEMVKPVRCIGKGYKRMGGQVKGETIVDDKGIPVPLRNIGKLVPHFRMGKNKPWVMEGTV